MNIYEFADIIDAQIECNRYPNQDRWAAKFYGCEVSEGCMLAGRYGNGKSATAAMNDYVAQIRGERLIFFAMSDKMRREYVCPKDLGEVPDTSHIIRHELTAEEVDALANR